MSAHVSSATELDCDGERLDAACFGPAHAIGEDDRHVRRHDDPLHQRSVFCVAAVCEVGAYVWLAADAEFASGFLLTCAQKSGLFALWLVYKVSVLEGMRYTHFIHANPGSTATRIPTARSVTLLPTFAIRPALS